MFTLDDVKANPDLDFVLAKTVDGKPMYRRVLNEAESYRAGMEAWVGLIASMWDLIGKPLDEKRLDLYCRQLKIVPYGLLEKGIAYAVRNNTYSNVPPVGVIWEGIRRELAFLNLTPNTDIADAIQRWDFLMYKRAVIEMETA